jgi:hypothetical protein
MRILGTTGFIVSDAGMDATTMAVDLAKDVFEVAGAPQYSSEHDRSHRSHARRDARLVDRADRLFEAEVSIPSR